MLIVLIFNKPSHLSDVDVSKKINFLEPFHPVMSTFCQNQEMGFRSDGFCCYSNRTNPNIIVHVPVNTCGIWRCLGRSNHKMSGALRILQILHILIAYLILHCNYSNYDISIVIKERKIESIYICRTILIIFSTCYE